MQLFDSPIHSTLCPSAPIEQYWLLYLFVSHSGLNVAPNVTGNVVKFNNCTRTRVWCIVQLNLFSVGYGIDSRTRSQIVRIYIFIIENKLNRVRRHDAVERNTVLMHFNWFPVLSSRVYVPHIPSTPSSALSILSSIPKYRAVYRAPSPYLHSMTMANGRVRNIH